jgi:hypothetical protein
MKARADVAELLRAGLSNAEIARRLHCDRHAVGDTRRALGLANVPMQPLSLEEKWRACTEPVEGGHLRWTGPRKNATGSPTMRYREKSISPAAIAFRIRTGREPQGYCYAECGYPHCVASAHADDFTTRQRDREALRLLTGRGAAPAVCPHGHDRAEHGGIQPDGAPYCRTCKREATQAPRSRP